MREKFPEIHFQSMVKLALVHRVELGQPKEFDKPRTVEEALAHSRSASALKRAGCSRTSCAKQSGLRRRRTGKQSMLKIPPTCPSCAQLDVNVYNAVTCTP
jgi:hypothetical protein